jgi:hypothetical protein
MNTIGVQWFKYKVSKILGDGPMKGHVGIKGTTSTTNNYALHCLTSAFSRLCLCVSIFILSIPICTGQFRYTSKSFATRSEVVAQHGMAATSHPLATQ